MEFPFYDAANTAAIICCHIVENKSPILYVSHDKDDGMWQFLCGQVHTTDEAKFVSLRWVFDFDHSVGVLADMPCGYYAERKNEMIVGQSKNDSFPFVGETAKPAGSQGEWRTCEVLAEPAIRSRSIEGLM